MTCQINSSNGNFEGEMKSQGDGKFTFVHLQEKSHMDGMSLKASEKATARQVG